MVLTCLAGAIRKEADDCRRVRLLFDILKLQYNEADVGNIQFLRNKLSQLSGTTHLPQACFAMFCSSQPKAFLRKHIGGTLSAFFIRDHGNFLQLSHSTGRNIRTFFLHCMWHGFRIYQVFIGSKYIGNYDDLQRLEDDGILKQFLLENGYEEGGIRSAQLCEGHTNRKAFHIRVNLE